MVSILMKEKTGYGPVQKGEDPWSCKVFKGEFIVPIPKEEMRQISQIKGVTPNYRLYRDPEVILYAGPTDFCPLDEKEIEYLLAVAPASVRLKEYLNEEDKKMKMDLIVGDKVVFKLKIALRALTAKVNAQVNGTIRYIGPHPDSDGIVFGIEIDLRDQAYHGKGTGNGRPYFSCGTNNAVFVAMDKIIKKQDTQDTSSQLPKPPVAAELPKATSITAQTKPVGAYDRVKDFVKEAAFSIEYNTAESRFKEEDRVMIQTVKEEVVGGTVRWVGPIRVSRDMTVDPIPVVGIETDIKIDPSKDFDGVSLNITASHGTKLFKVPSNHSRVFLPEQMVLSVDEYMQQEKESAARLKQGQKEVKQDNATEAEKRLAAEFGLTVAEYRRQKQGYVDAAKQGMDDRKVADDPKNDDKSNEERFAVGGGMIGGGGGRGNELTNTLQAMNFAGSGAVSKERIEEEKRILAEMKLKQQKRQQQEKHEQQQHVQHEVIEGGIEESIVEDNYVQISPYVSSYEQDNIERGRGGNNQQQQPNLPVMAEGMRVQEPQQSLRAQHLNEGETASLPSLLNDDTHNHNSPRYDPSDRYDHNRDYRYGHYDHDNQRYNQDLNRDHQGYIHYHREHDLYNRDYQGHGHHSHDNQDWHPHDPPGHHDHRDHSPHHPPDPSYPRDPYQGPPPDPHRQFTIGSMVCVDVQRGDPLYGVVKWIGTIPDYPGTIAGVEMERTLRDGTDGTWHGRRFFTCPYGKGYFCPLNTLKQDTRYMDEGQVPAHLRQDIDNCSNKEEIIKLKEEIHQLQTSIENLQLEKDTQQRTAKQQEQQWRNEKQQLLEEQKRLREEEVKQVQEQLETDKERLTEEIDQLKYEIEHLRRQITDLREAHHELQQETEKKEQVQAQLQSQVGRFSIENMRLKGQVKQLEESSATDIKYWEVSYKQVLTNKDTLGSGGWGKVEVGLLHGQKVAVKMLHSDIKSPYYNQLVRREISMLAKVRHPNLLLFIAGVLDHPSGSPIIITELLDTSLRKAYTDRLIVSDRVRISIMRDVAAALNYIHRQKESIIHRDVSSANVLLESRGEGNWKAKLSDFGSANLVQFSTTVGPGAIPYAAPEVPHNQTTKMDVYSYGVLLCEVLLSEFPFKERFPDMLQSLAVSWSLMHQLILCCTRHSVTDRVDMIYVLDTFNEKFADVSVKGFVPLA